MEKEIFEFHGKQMERLYNLVTKPKKIPIYDISDGRAEQVKINGKRPERDFDLEKGEGFKDNDYSD